MLGEYIMKNIEELLKDIGVEVPEDKKEDFEKLFHENYKTIAEVEKLKTKLETSQGDNSNLTERLEQSQNDLAELKEKLEASGEDATKIKELQAEVSNLQKKNEEAEAKYKADKEKANYISSIKDAMKDLKFSSESAKETFINKAVDKKFAIEDGKVLGFGEFVEDYKAKDSGAFVEKTDINLGGKSDKIDDPKSPSSTEKKHAF